jgi:hypothetical protein
MDRPLKLTPVFLAWYPPVWVVAALLLASCARQSVPTTNVVTVDTPRFSVSIPAPLERDGVQGEVIVQDRPVPCIEYFARTNGVYWLARDCDLSAGPDLTETQALEEAQGFLLQEAHGRLIAEEPLASTGSPARRLTADSALRGEDFDGQFQAILAVSSDHLYLISTYGFNGADQSDLERMGAFLSSFHLHPQ